MRGVRLKLPIEYNKYLSLLLAPINFNLYNWYVCQDEIVFFDELTQKPCTNMLNKDKYSGDEFKKVIDSKDYLIYLANIQAYPIGAAKSEIRTYDDFMKSKCRLIFLCADSEFVDIYCKDKDVIKEIYKICISHEFSEVDIITDDNDFRTRLML